MYPLPYLLKLAKPRYDDTGRVGTAIMAQFLLEKAALEYAVLAQGRSDAGADLKQYISCDLSQPTDLA